MWFDEVFINTINRHNVMFWFNEDPHHLLVKKIKSQSKLVLSEVSSKRIIDPSFSRQHYWSIFSPNNKRGGDSTYPKFKMENLLVMMNGHQLISLEMRNN